MQKYCPDHYIPELKLREAVQYWSKKNGHPVNIVSHTEISEESRGGSVAFVPKALRNGTKCVILVDFNGKVVSTTISDLMSPLDESFLIYMKNLERKFLLEECIRQNPTSITRPMEKVYDMFLSTPLDTEFRQMNFSLYKPNASVRRIRRAIKAIEMCDGECPVCYDKLNNIQHRFPCQHVLCGECYPKLNTCPICRCNKKLY